MFGSDGSGADGGGPEIDVCRHCQMMWFDAGELDEMPKRATEDVAADKWQDELRQMRRRREDSDFYTRMILRHFVCPF